MNTSPLSALQSSFDAPSKAARRFPTPARLRARWALSAQASERIERFRSATIDLVHGRDERLLCVVGPCSIHDPEAALEYATRLSPLAERYGSELLVVMRVYLEKPRSSVGWKGLISDPHLDGSCDMARGLDVARGLMVRIAELGLPIATELLDGNLSTYFTDVISWAAIGARTTESQPHRELASSLPFAVGFKNGTDGRLEGAVGGMLSAAQRHRRVAPNGQGRLSLSLSAGNPHCHLTLRGGTGGPNFDAPSVTAASEHAAGLNLPSRVLVDCSHGNSGKNHEAQPLVCAEVARQVKGGARHVLGVMIESHLVAGRQALGRGREGLRYGQSITDGCVDMEATEQMLAGLADAVRQKPRQ